MATLTQAFLVNCKAAVQGSGRQVLAMMVLPTALVDMLSWSPSVYNAHPAPIPMGNITEFGTVWGIRVWVDAFLATDTLELIDDRNVRHDFRYSAFPAGQTLRTDGIGQHPQKCSKVNSECPCGIVRAICDYHRSP